MYIYAYIYTYIYIYLTACTQIFSVNLESTSEVITKYTCSIHKRRMIDYRKNSAKIKLKA